MASGERCGRPVNPSEVRGRWRGTERLATFRRGIVCECPIPLTICTLSLLNQTNFDLGRIRLPRHIFFIFSFQTSLKLCIDY